MAAPLAALSTLLLALALVVCASAQLSVDFYSATCPNAAAIIKQAALQRFQQDEFSVPSVLRLISHDALVGNVSELTHITWSPCQVGLSCLSREVTVT